MKRLIAIALLLLIFGLSSCSSMGRVARYAVGGNYTSVPPPQPGLVLPINESPAVWVECFLFREKFYQRYLFAPCFEQRDCVTFTRAPIKHFIIDPPQNTRIKGSIISGAITYPLRLSPYPADYTLVAFHQNFVQRMTSIKSRSKGRWEIPFIKLEVEPFSVTGDPTNDRYDIGGVRYYADQIIRLSRVKPYQRRQLIFRRTFYPGHFAKEFLGLP